LSPDGRTFAANLGNTSIAFIRLESDARGRPTRGQVIGTPVAPAKAWFSMGRWSADSRHYLAADTAWGPRGFDAVRNGPGRIFSIAVAADGSHRVASEAIVSLSPEGFDLDPAGTLLAVANMERTYLPDGLPYSLFGRRDAASLSLVRFDPQSGGLMTIDGPLRLNAILPEDVVFDDSGDMIAVVSYQDRVEQPQAGSIEFFQVDRSGANPRLVPTGRRWPLPRGAHDLAVVRGQ
jgi:hypothetical protein